MIKNSKDSIFHQPVMFPKHNLNNDKNETVVLPLQITVILEVHVLISYPMQFSRSWSKQRSLLTTAQVLKNKDWFTRWEKRRSLQFRIITRPARMSAVPCYMVPMVSFPFWSCTFRLGEAASLSVQIMNTVQDQFHLPCLFYFYPNKTWHCFFVCFSH